MLSLLGWVLTTVPKGGFEEALAVQDTWLNQLMGCSSGIANWTCGLPCVKVPTLAREQASDVKRDTLALSVRMSASECAVIFRGTKNVYNVLEDLSFFPQAVPGCDGCKVHSGFADDCSDFASMWRHTVEMCGNAGKLLMNSPYGEEEI